MFGILFVYLDFRPETKLGRLERIIEKRYIGIEDVDMQEVEDAAANAMVNALGDRWSYYLNESAYENNISTQNNTYVGIGVSIFTELQDGCIVVEQVTPGGPAEEAGILAGPDPGRGRRKRGIHGPLRSPKPHPWQGRDLH